MLQKFIGILWVVGKILASKKEHNNRFVSRENMKKLSVYLLVNKKKYIPN
jgi:hypothetical protein